MRPTAIDKAIAKLEAEKAVLELAIQKLREQQKLATVKKRYRVGRSFEAVEVKA